MFESVFAIVGLSVTLFVAMLEAYKYVVNGPPEGKENRIQKIKNLCFYSIDAIVVLAVVVILLSKANRVHKLDPTNAVGKGEYRSNTEPISPKVQELDSSKSSRQNSALMKSDNENYFSLNVTSEIQGCKLFVDDLVYGSAPQIILVKSGRHKIRLEGDNLRFESGIQVDSSTALHVRESQFDFR